MTEKKTDFTARDAKFIEKLVEHNLDPSSRHDCAVEAGFKPGLPAVANAGRIIKRLSRNPELQDALQRQKVDMDKVATKIKDLMDCKHPFAPNQPDTTIQLKATETAIRVLDANPPQKFEVDHNEHREIVISMDVVHRLEQYDKMRGILPQAQETGEVIDVTPDAIEG